jgi:competence protein ComEC
MPIVYLSCAWLLGALVGPGIRIHPAWILLGVAPLPFSFVARQHRRFIVISCLSLTCFLGAAVYAGFAHTIHAENDIAGLKGSERVRLQGMVAAAPELTDEARIRFSIRSVERGGRWSDSSGLALLVLPRYPEYHYGDILIIEGWLDGRPQTPSSASTSAYWDYLAEIDIHAQMFYPRVEPTGNNAGNPVWAWVYSARSRLMAEIERVLPEPQAALTQGIAFGISTGIPPPLKDAFISTGTAHLLAVSGANLTIIAGIFLFVLPRLLGRKGYVYIWSTLAVVWTYATFTGLEPPVVRAAIMASSFLLADLFGRQRSGVVALVFSAALMVGLSPGILYDVSFQLSFAAMAGIVILVPIMDEWSSSAIDRFVTNPAARSIASYVATGFGVSLAAVLTTWPIAAHHFGNVSWIGPLATFVAAPSMPAIMVTGILAAAAGLVFLPLARVIGWIAWLPSTYMQAVVGGVAGISDASYLSHRLPVGFVALYFAALALFVMAYRSRQRLAAAFLRASALVSRVPLRWALPPVAVAAILVPAILFTLPDSMLHVNFLDVGQGDSILIVKGGRQVLVDGGPDPQPLLLALGRKMPFWDRTIDMVVLTHPDADHLGGLIEVLKRYRVTHILAANTTSDSPLFREWRAAIAARDIKCTVALSGQRITFSDTVTLTVLNPGRNVTSLNGDDLNQSSVVLRVKMGDASFLLTGDLPAETERELVMDRADLRSTVLKAGHHGSEGSTSEAFLSIVNPQAAVVSVGRGNTHGHPAQEVLSRLKEMTGDDGIYRTDEQGTIEFTTDGERLWVKTEK